MGCGRPKHADCRLCVPVECVAAPALTRIRACDHLPNMAKPGCSAHFTERRVGARYAKLDGSERFRLQTYQHVKILLKFEVLGPRNGRGATCQNGFQSTVRL